MGNHIRNMPTEIIARWEERGDCSHEPRWIEAKWNRSTGAFEFSSIYLFEFRSCSEKPTRELIDRAIQIIEEGPWMAAKVPTSQPKYQGMDPRYFCQVGE